MISIFSSPRNFNGIFDIIQQNAINSWLLIDPAIEIYLIDKSDNIPQYLLENKRINWLTNVEHNEFGTPLMNSMIKEVEKKTNNNYLLYVSSDIILFPDTLKIIQPLFFEKKFCAVCIRRDYEQKEPIKFENGWDKLIQDKLSTVNTTNPMAGDFFMFPKNFWENFPPFALGRTMVDGWMMYQTLNQKAKLIDVTPSLIIGHQNHDYGHHPGGREGVYKGEEAIRNEKLAGGWQYAFSIKDSNFLLRNNKILKKGIYGKRIMRKLFTKLVMKHRFYHIYKIVYAILKRFIYREFLTKIPY